MDIPALEAFFFWCMVVNSVIYAITALAVLFMRDFVCKVQQKMFGMDESATLKSIQRYLANYKLFITVFNFTPWIALLIVK